MWWQVVSFIVASAGALFSLYSAFDGMWDFWSRIFFFILFVMLSIDAVFTLVNMLQLH